MGGRHDNSLYGGLPLDGIFLVGVSRLSCPGCVRAMPRLSSCVRKIGLSSEQLTTHRAPGGTRKGRTKLRGFMLLG